RRGARGDPIEAACARVGEARDDVLRSRGAGRRVDDADAKPVLGFARSRRLVRARVIRRERFDGREDRAVRSRDRARLAGPDDDGSARKAARLGRERRPAVGGAVRERGRIAAARDDDDPDAARSQPLETGAQGDLGAKRRDATAREVAQKKYESHAAFDREVDGALPGLERGILEELAHRRRNATHTATRAIEPQIARVEERESHRFYASGSRTPPSFRSSDTSSRLHFVGNGFMTTR